MTFWVGLFIGWCVGSIGTGLALMFFTAVKDRQAYDQEERLKGRRE